MNGSARRLWTLPLVLSGLIGCNGCDACGGPSKPAASASSVPSVPTVTPGMRRMKAATKVDVSEKAMGTEVRFLAYTEKGVDEAKIRAAFAAGLKEIRRLEDLMTSWKDDSEVGQINKRAGQAVKVSPETFAVFEKSAWASEKSAGTFDVTFKTLSDLWKFGDAAAQKPEFPKEQDIKSRLAHLGWRKVELDKEKQTVKVPVGTKVGLGGIAKGYAVDRAVAAIRKAGVQNFLAQAGGDLFGSGKKPDNHLWVSGIRDPRGKASDYFAQIPLQNRAFSTAGDYARSFVLEGKRYHHIIDPRTGYPATACRSVTVWARDAFTADAIDDAVFILGVEEGLKLVESLDGVGAVIVDNKNRVHISKRLKAQLQLLGPPTDGI